MSEIDNQGNKMTLDDIFKEINKVQQQNNQIVTQNNEIKKELTDIKKDFETIRQSVNTCQEELNSVQLTQNKILKEFDAHKKQQFGIINTHTEITQCCEDLKQKVKTLEKKLLEETIIRSNNENNSRKMNVEISGIPIIPNEDCKAIVANIGVKLGIDITKKDVDVAHRLYKKNDQHIPIIIARFYSRTDRDDYFYARAGLKSLTIMDLGFQATPETNKNRNKIYINESLSVYTKLLFKHCRQKCHDLGFSSCFVNNGIIYVKKSQEANKIRINSIYDAEKHFVE